MPSAVQKSHHLVFVLDTYDKDCVKYFTLEHLQECRITVSWFSYRRLDFLNAIALKWKLPCLCRFTGMNGNSNHPKSHYLPQIFGCTQKTLGRLSITAPLNRTQ